MKVIKKIGLASIAVATMISLTACGGNNQKNSSKSPDKTESVTKKGSEHTKRVNKPSNKKATEQRSKSEQATQASKPKQTIEKTNDSSNNQAGSNNSQTSADNGVNNTQKTTQQLAGQTGQKGSEQQSTNQDSAVKIHNANQAADLMVHSMGYSYNRGQYQGVAEADGYHVKSTENQYKQEEYIVKPNGDVYNMDGSLNAKFADLIKPTQNQPDGWSGAQK